MAATMLGSLLVSLGLESGEFKSGLAAAEKEMRASAKRIEAIGSKMATLGRNMALGITLPLAAIGVASFKAASDVAELQSAFDATFGSAAASVRKWAEETGNAMGRSTQEIQAAALSYQELFSKAFDLNKAAEMSKQFAVLTQDLASFKNLSNEVAQQKIFSGLVGEAEPLRAVGVLLSETAVKAKAMELGLAGAKEELSEQDKIASRAAIILEQLSTAQGDVIRTSGSAANQIKTAKAAFDELQVAIGTKLLPALTPLITKVAELLTAFGSLPDGVQTGILAFAGLAAVVGPLIGIIGGLIRVLGPTVALIRTTALTATAAGVATSTFSAALAVLRVRLIAALAALGPYALAVGALAAVLYLVTRRSSEETAAAKRYTDAQEEAKAATEKATTAVDALATAHGAARVEALRLAHAERENIKQKLASARASLILAKAELARAQSFRAAQYQVASSSTGVPGTGLFIQGTGDRKVASANENLKTAQATEKLLANTLASIEKQISAPAPDISIPSVNDGKGKGKGAGGSKGGGSGASAAEVSRRFNDELANYDQQSLAARQRMALSADERADLELRSLELARIRTRDGIMAEEDYSKAQKDRLLASVDKAAAEERAAIEFQHQMEIERETTEMAQVRFDNQRDLLRNEYDMADTQAERKRLALELLAIEQQYRRNQLEMVIASKTAGDAEKERARVILASLAEIQAGETASTARANETQLERYMRDINKTPEQMNEAIDEIKIRGLENLNDQLVDAIVNFKSLGDVAKNVVKSIIADLLRLQIQKSIIAPLANLLNMGASGGFTGDGAPGNAGGMDLRGFGGARANGGGVSAGKMYLTSEDGPEIFQAGRSGRIISNRDLRELSGGAGGIAAIVPSPYFDVVVDGRIMRAGPGIASEGAAGGVSQMHRSGRRRVA